VVKTERADSIDYVEVTEPDDREEVREWAQNAAERKSE